MSFVALFNYAFNRFQRDKPAGNGSRQQLEAADVNDNGGTI